MTAQVNADELKTLPDPEFFACWARLRNRLAMTSPANEEIKRKYDAVLAEYRRRIDGGMAS